MSVKVVQLDLARPLTPVWVSDQDTAVYGLVMYLGQPVGWVYIDGLSGPAVSTSRLSDEIRRQVGWCLVPLALPTALAARATTVATPPPISVIVCTRDRSRQLSVCLESLTAIDYPRYEILVVDNASRTDETARLAADFPVRYFREDRIGLDCARNRGICEACHEIVAFTDDDASVDRLWLSAIAHAFQGSNAMSVTGFVAPAELKTRAQICFEFSYGGMSHGFRRRVVSRDHLSERELLWASSFGVGANMAFRKEVFTEIGLFDEQLGVGTSVAGAGDVEMFHRLVATGHTLVYEPRAIVWHTHRKDWGSLRRQLKANGQSFGAYLIACARGRTVRKRSILRFALLDWLGHWLVRRLIRSEGFPRHLVVAELLGAIQSPGAYLAVRLRRPRCGSARPRQVAPCKRRHSSRV